MKSYRTTVSPKQAAEWLKTNTRNRPITQRRVVDYAEQMKAGKWKLTGESIKFDATRKLIDGQTRLTACVMANTPFETYVCEGLEPDAFNYIDQGLTRSLSHAFGRDRKKNCNILAAAVRMLWLLENGEPIQGGSRLAIDDGFQVLQRHPSVERFTDLASSWKGATCPLPPSVLAAFSTWTHERHGDKATVFWSRVATGQDLSHGSPEQMLYKRLMQDRDSPERVHRDARTAYCVKAFNAFIGNVTLKRLSFDMSKEERPVFA